jgi:hypothetical protein
MRVHCHCPFRRLRRVALRRPIVDYSPQRCPMLTRPLIFARLALAVEAILRFVHSQSRRSKETSRATIQRFRMVQTEKVDPAATVKYCLTVQTARNRQVRRALDYYNFDAILAVRSMEVSTGFSETHMFFGIGSATCHCQPAALGSAAISSKKNKRQQLAFKN